MDMASACMPLQCVSPVGADITMTYLCGLARRLQQRKLLKAPHRSNADPSQRQYISSVQFRQTLHLVNTSLPISSPDAAEMHQSSVPLGAALYHTLLERCTVCLHLVRETLLMSAATTYCKVKGVSEYGLCLCKTNNN